MGWPYGIGLDIGIASVGWAVVALDENAQPCGIIKMGSRIFDKAEQPKTGESLAAPRREARGMRRRLRRKALRREDVYALLAQQGIAKREALARIFEAGHLEDIYVLRTRALDERVSGEEFARILLHLAQRRGFKSNRRGAGKEDGKLLQAVQENRRRMEQNGYRTAGEMLCKDPFFAAHKRNKAEEYLSTLGRDMVAAEAQTLFERQRELGAAWATPECEAEYLSILLRQRSFEEGPSEPSPYAGNQVEKKIGRCTLEPDQPRAPKNAASFEYFTLLQKVNHIRLIEQGETRPLTDEQRNAVVKLAYRSPEVDYARIRKELALPEQVRFNGVRYSGSVQDFAKCEKKEKLPRRKGYFDLCNALDKETVDAWSTEQQDAIVLLLCTYKNEELLRQKLREQGLDAAQAEALLDVNFSGFGHLSAKACRALIPYLEQGMTYDQACTAAGYDFRAHEGKEKSRLLPAVKPEMEDITSPVVRRAVAQTIKVINAIIREQGQSPVWLHIELARELRKSFEERTQMEKSMQENAANNEKLMKDIRETFRVISPTGQDLVKYKLWKEQDGRCAYSGRVIQAERLFESGYAEVDHIVPYSISFDDTYSNKVLVLSAENRQKGNRLPMQYLQGQRRDEFVVWTNRTVKNYRKRQNLLKTRLTEEDRQGFRQRNLQDTQYMARFLLNYIRDYLEFAAHPAMEGKVQRVTALSGAITAHLRKRWGLTKVRENGDLHHAVDAVVIACATQGMVQQISSYYGHIESEYEQDEDGSGSTHSRTKERFPAPWPHFREELEIRLSEQPQEGLLRLNPMFYSAFDVTSIRPVFVSRMPRHKVEGAAHKETIKGAKALADGIVTVRRPLTDLKLDKEGEIANYYMPQSDRLLYEALRARLQAAGGDGAKAFAEPFYKPKADGTPGPLVRKVKLYEKTSLTVPVRNGAGVADNDSMVRIDVFCVPGDGYYWVPIYVADTLKAQLPNRAVVAFKPYSEWKEMKDEDFLFSLYPNDLIEVEHKQALKFVLANAKSTLPKTINAKKALVYYVSGGISVGSITVETPENAYTIKSLGVKTLKSIKKYQVDVLGNYYEVKKEPRQTFR
jgi:CRISPR-associated endonuclease Csn1